MLQLGPGNGAGSQERDAPVQARDDRRLEADFAVPALDDQGNPVSKFLTHIGGAGDNEKTALVKAAAILRLLGAKRLLKRHAGR